MKMGIEWAKVLTGLQVYLLKKQKWYIQWICPCFYQSYLLPWNNLSNVFLDIHEKYRDTRNKMVSYFGFINGVIWINNGMMNTYYCFCLCTVKLHTRKTESNHRYKLMRLQQCLFLNSEIWKMSLDEVIIMVIFSLLIINRNKYKLFYLYIFLWHLHLKYCLSIIHILKEWVMCKGVVFIFYHVKSSTDYGDLLNNADHSWWHCLHLVRGVNILKIKSESE